MNVSRRTCLMGILSAMAGMAAALLPEAARAQVGGTRRRSRHRRRRRRTRRRLTVLPSNHTTTEVEGKTYYVVDGVKYEAVMEEGETVYVEVVE